MQSDIVLTITGGLLTTDTIALLALVTALGALAWNIVRDIVKDRVVIELSIAFGEVGNIKDSRTGLFADAGSLLPEHKFDSPCMFVGIVNTGNKAACISSVGGELKTQKHFAIAVAGLPKMLQPYEIFSTTSLAKMDFVQRIHEGNVSKLWVTDTKGIKWTLSSNGWERLSQTASYIASKKHL